MTPVSVNSDSEKERKSVQVEPESGFGDLLVAENIDDYPQSIGTDQREHRNPKPIKFWRFFQDYDGASFGCDFASYQ